MQQAPRPWTIYAIAALSGANVLAIEILGTRVLGPFYGVTLFLWSALITVTLLSLSVGYALGGRQADREASVRVMARLMVGAGVWMTSTVWTARPIIAGLESLGLRAAVLLAALILFVPPLTLLGMISPIAVRAKTTRLADVGRAAGNLYAVSTVGGVAAALGTGFFIIPKVGVRSLTVLIGLSLLCGAAATMLGDKRRRAGGVVAMVALLGLGGGLSAGLSTAAARSGRLRAIEQSHHGELRVLDYGDGSRHLLIDGGVHSSVMIGTWASLQPYIWVTDITKGLYVRPANMLLIGLGAGSTAKSFEDDGWAVKAIEIDPAVVRTAKRYFGLKLAGENIFITDGRRHLKNTAERYALVVLDAFSSNSIPFHLFTEEAFALIASRLADGGVLAMNIESLGWRSPMVKSVAASLKKTFRHVVALPVNRDPKALTNLIVLASDGDLPSRPFDSAAAGLLGDSAQAQTRRTAWKNRFEPETEGALVLTDDRSPVDVWSESINAANRLELNRGLAKDGLAGVNW